MTVRGVAAAFACAASVAATFCTADTLNDVVLEYETLAHQMDASDGPDWPDVSAAAAAQRARSYAVLGERLAKLPEAGLSGEDRLTRELLDWRLDILAAGAQFDEDRIAFDNGDGFFNTANYAAQTTVIANEADAKAWIARLHALPVYYNAQIANMRRGIATNFTQPRPTAESVLRILKIAADQPVDASPLLNPLAAMPATISAERRLALQAEARAAIAAKVKRYIAWPAQALAYKVGEIKLVELRARAERTLGAGFDIREFHDLLLTSGPMPLSIVERRVDAWIDAQGAALTH